jgi:hypothetical protein
MSDEKGLRRRWFYLSSTVCSPIPNVAHHLNKKRTKTACGLKLPETYARWWKLSADMKRDHCPDCRRALRKTR